MKMKSWMLGAAAVAIMFGSVLISDALGYWQTESTKTPAVITTGEFAGEADPADIRGSYSFGDVEAAFGVRAKVLAEAFGVDPADAESFQLKSLETVYEALAEVGTEVGTGSVRYFVALYTGLPYALTEEVYLPQPAVDLLIKEGKVAGEAAEALKAIAVEIPAAKTGGAVTEESTEQSSADAAASGEAEGDASLEGLLIKGKTTFREVLDAGVSEADLERALGAEMPNPLTVIKTFCTEQGLDFETVKTALQALVEAE